MYEFLKFGYWIFAIVAIIYEIWSVQDYNSLASIRGRLSGLKDLPKKDRIGHIFDGYEDGDNRGGGVCLFIIFQLLYIIWCLVGLFSSQWIVFIVIFIMSLLHKLWKSYVGNFIDSFITVSLLIFALLNTYHFHINVWNWLVG